MERNNSAYFRLKKIPCGFKEQARARHPGEKCELLFTPGSGGNALDLVGRFKMLTNNFSDIFVTRQQAFYIL